MDCGCRSHNGFLTSKGLAEAAKRDRQVPGIADMAFSQYLDIPGSVSGLRRDEILYAHVTDQLLLEQEARFLNGT